MCVPTASRGVDVLTTPAAGRLETADIEHLKIARSDRQVHDPS